MLFPSQLPININVELFGRFDYEIALALYYWSTPRY